ncbi:MAG: quinone oxidoreductase [Myxococcales bacterium]|nr:quinone oxidoreductase [Myxococcales bacterium]
MTTHETTAVRIHETGGPEVLRLERLLVGEPGEGQALVRQTAVGLNFIDVYHRTGLYPVPLPYVLGQEGAGVVEAVGPGVTTIAPGDRVAYASVAGAYAGHRLVPADKLLRLPAHVSEESAAALMLKGMTARYLLRATTSVGPGQTIVVHAAAGGTGQLLVRWAKHLGAKVVGVVGSEPKAEAVRALGADVVVVGTTSLVKTALDLTGGRGVDVVYDSVGKDTFDLSLECLRVRGLCVSFGQASGPVPPMPLAALAKKSLFLTRPSLFAYTATRAELEETAADLFSAMEAGAVTPDIGQRLPLSAVADAHRALEARRTLGATVLLPEAER